MKMLSSLRILHLRQTAHMQLRKLAAEHLVRAAHHTFGLDTVVTRCGNNYGPRQFPEKFLPLVLSNAVKDEAIPVYVMPKCPRLDLR